MDLSGLESKAKGEAARVIDGAKAEAGKGAQWFEDHRVIGLTLGVLIGTAIVAWIIVRI